MNSSLIITGGGQGLGRALAIEASERGYSVALIGRTLEKLEETRRTLRTKTTSTCHAFDLSVPGEVAVGIADVVSRHPAVKGLINNAGAWLGRREIRDLTRQDMEDAFARNFYCAFEPTQALLAQFRLKKSDDKFSVAFIGATASLSGRKGVAPFCLGKVALRTYAQSLARELGPEGIHVSHFIIDGVLDNDRTVGLNPENESDRFMKQDQLAKQILNVMEQDRSCWTFEMDLRPFNEPW